MANEESGVDKLTRAAYHLLGLGTHFTAGERSACLDFKRGMKAPQAACIHSDFEEGFIRAVTMILVKYGSEKAVKKQDACAKKEKNM